MQQQRVLLVPGGREVPDLVVGETLGPVTPSIRNPPWASLWPNEHHSRAVWASTSATARQG